jgi:hypothetical protein
MLTLPLADLCTAYENMGTPAINMFDGGSWPKERIYRCVPVSH